MNTLTDILAEYGLGIPELENEEQLQERLEKIFDRYDDLSDYLLEEEIFRKSLNIGVGTVIVDLKRFKRNLQKNEIDIRPADWEFKTLMLEVLDYGGARCRIELGTRDWHLKDILIEQMKTHPEQMKKEDRAFCLSYAFEPEKALTQKIDASQEKMNHWLREVNASHFMFHLQQKISDELWKKYNLIREKNKQ